MQFYYGRARLGLSTGRLPGGSLQEVILAPKHHRGPPNVIPDLIRDPGGEVGAVLNLHAGRC